MFPRKGSLGQGVEPAGERQVEGLCTGLCSEVRAQQVPLGCAFVLSDASILQRCLCLWHMGKHIRFSMLVRGAKSSLL